MAEKTPNIRRKFQELVSGAKQQITNSQGLIDFCDVHSKSLFETDFAWAVCKNELARAYSAAATSLLKISQLHTQHKRAERTKKKAPPGQASV